MATFIERLKKEKIFRLKMISIAIVAILIYNSVGEDKKTASETYCNSLISGLTTTEEFNTCKGTPGCYAWSELSGNFPLYGDDLLVCIARVLGTTTMVEGCTSSIKTGQFGIDSAEGCESGFGIKQGTLCGYTMYQCAAVDPDTECSNPKEQRIAKMIWKMGLFEGDCKAGYYSAIFGGAMAVFMVFAVI